MTCHVLGVVGEITWISPNMRRLVVVVKRERDEPPTGRRQLIEVDFDFGQVPKVFPFARGMIEEDRSKRERDKNARGSTFLN